MRIEQTIATVARLAVAVAREIKVVESFATAMHLHCWQLRTSLGMSSYPDSALLSLSDAGPSNPGPGCKRGRSKPSPLAMVTAGTPAGLTRS